MLRKTEEKGWAIMNGSKEGESWTYVGEKERQY